MNSSSDEDVDVQDADSCTEAELNQMFKQPLHLGAEEAISLKKSYILHLDVSQNFDKVVATTSQDSVHLFDLNAHHSHYSLSHINVDAADKIQICGVRFSKADPNIVFIATTNGRVFQQDLRQRNAESFDLTENTDKLITCIDNNSDNSVLCVGTEQTSSESLLLFFDIRQRKTSFTFSDSHKDDITDLKFHPTLPNLLASGSTDGLINVFDVMNSDEDDALLHCLNTESSVQTLNWHEVDAGRNKISCITHLNDFIVYDVEESEQIVSFKRSAITKAIRRKSPNECYLVNAHSIDQNNILLLAGSNFNKGECLRTLSLTGKELSSRSNIEANKQIVRCSAYDAKNDLLITVGEGGIVSVWQKTTSAQTIASSGKRKEVKHKVRKSRPY